MDELKSFIAALKEWAQSAEDADNVLVFVAKFTGALFDKGDKPWIEVVEERLAYLVTEVDLDEGWLVDSLIRLVQQTLERSITHQGQFIIQNERTLARIQAEDSPFDKDDNLFTDTLKKLKDPSYYPRALKELSTWERIVANRLSREQRYEWSRDRDYEEFERMKQSGKLGK